ncbi:MULTISPECIES: methyltransferase domain-containing protein [Rhodomicrobium]|uniref:class I SAM-dependent methyltransferase n=1 Tax=Rhodomicrobium TaxID=1068 RepID=UPI001482AE7B|nr:MULTISPECIES: methyltransferase domain-containing protein [Rhodomicrobium]
MRILDVGSYNVDGSLRDFKPESWEFIGADLEAGPGVDVLMEAPDRLPFADDDFDAVISSSTYERAAHFWMLLLETVRVTRPGGYIYINAPSNGAFRQFPLDYWRFYPDAGLAFVDWVRKNGQPLCLIESGIAGQDGEAWSDFIAVLQKSENPSSDKPFMTAAAGYEFRNIRRFGHDGLIDPAPETEDQARLRVLEAGIAERDACLLDLEQQLAAARSRLAHAERMLGSPRRLLTAAMKRLVPAPFRISARR